MARTFVTFPITKVIGGSSLINPYVHVQASLFPMAFVYWIDGLARTKGISDGMGKKKYFGDLNQQKCISSQFWRSEILEAMCPHCCTPF